MQKANLPDSCTGTCKVRILILSLICSESVFLRPVEYIQYTVLVYKLTVSPCQKYCKRNLEECFMNF